MSKQKVIKDEVRFNARIPGREMEVLRRYCEERCLTQTEVFRGFIRSLEKQGSEADRIAS